MDVFDGLKKSSSPVVLTIGMFDGIHLGHKMILEQVKNKADALNASTALITFSNHPSTVLRPAHPTPLIGTLDHRLKLMENAGIDHVYVLPFNLELAKLSAEKFLKKVCNALDVVSLVLGSDATIGRNRHGDRQAVEAISSELYFSVEYLEDSVIDGERVSSSKIRSLVRSGDFIGAGHFLGRRYSIYAPVVCDDSLDVDGLCLPPNGTYEVTCKIENAGYRAVVTVKDNALHLNVKTLGVGNQCIEVFF